MSTATLDQELNLAVEHFQAGRLADSEQLCRQVLAQQPDHALALHMLGLVAHRVGRLDIACDLIERAIAVQPTITEFHCNLGMVRSLMDDFDRAITAYQHALAIDPLHPQACARLANAFQRKGDLPQAIGYYLKALAMQPDYPEARNDLGNTLRGAGKPQEAIAQYRLALQQRPNFPECHNNLAVSLMETNQLEEAEIHCRKALELNPDYAEVLANLGNTLAMKKDYEKAIECYRRSIALMPGLAETHTNMGIALLNTGKIDESIAAFHASSAIAPMLVAPYCNLASALESKGEFEQAIAFARRAIELQPDCPEAFNNLGNNLRQLYRFDEAAAAFQQAIHLRPQYPEAHNNLGGSLVSSGKTHEAVDKFRQAIALRPTYMEANANLAMVQLLLGDFHGGWKQYETRRQNPVLARPHITQPMWDGADLAGKRIVLHAEQGIGDTLHFVRYIPQVQARGGKIILECQGLVYPLLKSFKGIEQCVSRNDPLPPHDVQCSLLSLPWIFNTNLNSIPADVPYIFADAELSDRWRTRLRETKQKHLKIGLVWAGRSDYTNDRNRSMLLSVLSPLGKVPGTWFYSLQKGKASEQALNPPAGMKMTDWSMELNDFADTAALVDNLDLIISVDTAVAHLAGAMAKPVWTLLPFAPDWRWMLDRSDSPWYPTMRLFRQHRPGDWSGTLEEMAKSLSQLTRERGNA